MKKLLFLFTFLFLPLFSQNPLAEIIDLGIPECKLVKSLSISEAGVVHGIVEQEDGRYDLFRWDIDTGLTTVPTQLNSSNFTGLINDEGEFVYTQGKKGWASSYFEFYLWTPTEGAKKLPVTHTVNPNYTIYVTLSKPSELGSFICSVTSNNAQHCFSWNKNKQDYLTNIIENSVKNNKLFFTLYNPSTSTIDKLGILDRDSGEKLEFDNPFPSQKNFRIAYITEQNEIIGWMHDNNVTHPFIFDRKTNRQTLLNEDFVPIKCNDSKVMVGKMKVKSKEIDKYLPLFKNLTYHLGFIKNGKSYLFEDIFHFSADSFYLCEIAEINNANQVPAIIRLKNGKQRPVLIQIK